ncbi:MAG TPA: 4-(cytidine 5'-diphospho)-2-C-methyl-D-erythritol kinase [Candidatus Enterocola sp.]|nr:MAG: 4-diphosphocytidyl-2-C-methyl-D-erythritol kinase [Bacteroidetes bacterium ADurb.Bin302]HOH95770.1 4-(cytidine 5'-diphospho)-2-C-methyl-D-erythritol kinase [Candidatus Enterocola sp.]
MITYYPNAKINLGLNIVEKRPDGYHNIETIFYPIPLCDSLSIKSAQKLDFKILGITIDGNIEDNLVMKAYRLIEKDYNIPPISIILEKKIPFGAGLGGGSADAAYMLRLLSDYFKLSISNDKLEHYASKLGADCPFFIKNEAVFASGIGNIFELSNISLKGYYMMLFKPNISVSTADAYRMVVPSKASFDLRQLQNLSIEKWHKFIFNDFEHSVFTKYPQIASIKEDLYASGAIYASMSGSGSAVFGIYKKAPDITSMLQSDIVWQGFLS